MSEVSLLLVEDDGLLASWVRLALQGTEFRLVGRAATGAEAITLVERLRPDLLLVDYHLPDARGTELVSELRRRSVRVPVVLTTGGVEGDFNQAARSAGAQGTLIKSGSIARLLETLQAVAAGQNAFDACHLDASPSASPWPAHGGGAT